jgi:hypothetical protein
MPVALVVIAILSSVACLAVSHFSTSSDKRNDLQKKLLNMKFLFWLSQQLLYEIFLILRRIDQDVIVNVYWL